MNTKQNMDIVKNEVIELCRKGALMEDIRQFLLKKGIEEKRAQELSIYYFIEVENEKKRGNNIAGLAAVVIGIVMCIVGIYKFRISFIVFGFLILASGYAISSKIKEQDKID